MQLNDFCNCVFWNAFPRNWIGLLLSEVVDIRNVVHAVSMPSPPLGTKVQGFCPWGFGVLGWMQLHCLCANHVSFVNRNKWYMCRGDIYCMVLQCSNVFWRYHECVAKSWHGVPIAIVLLRVRLYTIMLILHQRSIKSLYMHAYCSIVFQMHAKYIQLKLV